MYEFRCVDVKVFLKFPPLKLNAYATTNPSEIIPVCAIIGAIV